MYQGLLHLHNLLRWIILLLAVIAIIRSFSGMVSSKPFTSTDKKVGLFLMISAHLMLLIGLYQWLIGPWGLKNILNSGMAAVMKDHVFRYWAVEHITGMLIAIILITIGRGVSKKTLPDKTKHKKTFWYFFIALLIILATSPWPSRVGIGRPLFPGMEVSG
ncbi:MAG: hypothetical protein ABIN89_19550 [Chitinophagaceae bacterium]